MNKRERPKLAKTSYFVDEKEGYQLYFMKVIDLSGQKFTRLTVIKRVGSRPHFGAIWLCQCICGSLKSFGSGELRKGRAKSCGCLAAELSAKRLRKHGNYYNPSYKAWTHMLDRCYNRNDPSYANYGGRGISVCNQWMKFENFLFDMGERPANLTLERIDTNGNYELKNCCWATHKDQNRNTRRTKLNVSLAAEIRKLRNLGWSYTGLATKYKVDYAVIYNVCIGKTWQ